MKKLFLAGVLLGVLNFAQATPYTFTTTSLKTMSGESYYNWGINSGLTALKADLTGGEQILSATLTYNNIQFTVAGPNLGGAGWLYTQLLGTSASSGITTHTDNDATTDAFTSGIQIYKDVFAKAGLPAATLNEIFGVSALALLTADVLNGFIDIGIDPDCVYKDTGITLTINTGSTTNYTSVPDAASTAMLLGAGLSCIGLLRRKLS
ncbi:MAG TPA: hypothetical protein VHY30_03230 [Verrucomicrobiae bacterium]|jgi:hypothetical protein|nr:hypothetical protein [Verrucomicrobiae bacterium]